MIQFGTTLEERINIRSAEGAKFIYNNIYLNILRLYIFPMMCLPAAKHASPRGIGHVPRKHMSDPKKSLMLIPRRRRWYVRLRRLRSRNTCWIMKVEEMRDTMPVHLGAIAIALSTGTWHFGSDNDTMMLCYVCR